MNIAILKKTIRGLIVSISFMLLTAESSVARVSIPPILGKIPPAVAALSLPSGRLSLLRAGPGVVDFLDVERSHYTRDGGIILVYEVWVPPIPTHQGPAAQAVRRFKIDCPKNTTQDLGEMTYGSDGNVVLWLPDYPARPITDPGSLYEAQYKLVCLSEVSLFYFPNYKKAFNATNILEKIVQSVFK